jgi:hypothetical protein
VEALDRCLASGARRSAGNRNALDPHIRGRCYCQCGVSAHGFGESVRRSCCPGCSCSRVSPRQRLRYGRDGCARAGEAGGSSQSSPAVASQTYRQCRLKYAPTIARPEPLNRAGRPMPKDLPVNRMVRLSASALRPTAPILTLEQKRYRIERFRVCIKRLEEFGLRQKRAVASASRRSRTVVHFYRDDSIAARANRAWNDQSFRTLANVVSFRQRLEHSRWVARQTRRAV